MSVLWLNEKIMSMTEVWGLKIPADSDKEAGFDYRAMGLYPDEEDGKPVIQRLPYPTRS